MNKLPDTTIIEESEEEDNELMDIKEVPRESPFEEEPKPVQEQVNYSMLTSKKLKELAKSKGYRGYSKLTKPNLIRMLKGEELDVIPIKKKTKPKVEKKLVETKPKELKKEEVLIKDDVVEPIDADATTSEEPEEPIEEEPIEEEPIEEEEVVEEVVEEPKPKKVIKKKPKKKSTPKPREPIVKAKEPLVQKRADYNPFKQTFRIM